MALNIPLITIPSLAQLDNEVNSDDVKIPVSQNTMTGTPIVNDKTKKSKDYHDCGGCKPSTCWCLCLFSASTLCVISHC